MATNHIHDLYYEETSHIIAGDRRVLYFNTYHDQNKQELVDLTNIQEIKFLLSPYSVLKEKNTAIIVKKFTQGQINIIEGSTNNIKNIIQVILDGRDTEYLQGGFLYQLVIIDSAGESFVRFEGVININKLIQEPK